MEKSLRYQRNMPLDIFESRVATLRRNRGGGMRDPVGYLPRLVPEVWRNLGRPPKCHVIPFFFLFLPFSALFHLSTSYKD